MRPTLALAAALLACGLGACGSNAEPDAAAAAQKSRRVSVRAVQAKHRHIDSWVYAQGTARATRREFLSFQQQGRVVYLKPGLEIGHWVRRGELIAQIEPARAESELASARAGVTGAKTELKVAAASLREALAQRKLAQLTSQRFEILIGQNSASQQEYDEAVAKLAQADAAVDRARAQIAAYRSNVNSARSQVEAAQVTVADTRIVAPISGRIARLNLERGRYFSSQQVNTKDEASALATVPVVIIDDSSFEIAVDVPFLSTQRLAVGNEVLIRIDQDGPPRVRGAAPSATRSAAPLPDEDTGGLRGRVTAISPALDPKSRTARVIVRTANGGEGLLDGRFVSLWISDAVLEPRLAIPLSAIRYRDNRPFVMVVDPKTRRVSERMVAVGTTGTELREVTKGLKPGEWVVSEGAGMLANGDLVRVLGRKPDRDKGAE